MTRLRTLQPDSIVVVNDDEPLSFHNSDSMETTVDMDTMTLAEAREHGAVACSHCFDDQSCMDYDVDYSIEVSA